MNYRIGSPVVAPTTKRSHGYDIFKRLCTLLCGGQVKHSPWACCVRDVEGPIGVLYFSTERSEARSKPDGEPQRTGTPNGNAIWF